jgi:hypothetical protein
LGGKTERSGQQSAGKKELHSLFHCKRVFKWMNEREYLYPSSELPFGGLQGKSAGLIQPKKLQYFPVFHGFTHYPETIREHLSA